MNQVNLMFSFILRRLYSAGNREPEAELRIAIHNSCYYDVTQQILARIPEQYHIPVYIVVGPYQSLFYGT